VKKRAALIALLASVLAVPAVGLAQTPCDALPPTVTQSYCKSCPGGIAVLPGRVAGNGLDYVDQWHAQCEIYRNNNGIDQCKGETTCPPGWEKFQDGGVWKCRQPATDQAKDNCYRGLRISISQVKTADGLPLTNNVITKPGPVKLLIDGDGTANATSATIGGGIGATIGDAARRLGSSPGGTCLPPNCQVVYLDNLGNAPVGHQTLTLKTPRGYASASVEFDVVNAPPPVIAGDPQCALPDRQAHLRMQLIQNSVSGGQSVSGNQVILSSLPAAAKGQQAWTLTLHQSFLGSISPVTVTSPPANPAGPVTFSFSAPPAQPVPQMPSGGQPGGRVGHGVPFGPTYRCVWARLEWGGGWSEEVAVPVALNP
jgi:hypothetical protein